MKVNLSGGPVTLTGERFKMEGEKDKLFEFKAGLENAILANYPDEGNISGEEKIKRWKLALRIHESTEDTVHLSSDEIVLIKRLVAKAYSIPVTAQIWMLLEGEALQGKPMKLVEKK